MLLRVAGSVLLDNNTAVSRRGVQYRTCSRWPVNWKKDTRDMHEPFHIYGKSSRSREKELRGGLLNERCKATNLVLQLPWIGAPCKKVL